MSRNALNCSLRRGVQCSVQLSTRGTQKCPRTERKRHPRAHRPSTSDCPSQHFFWFWEREGILPVRSGFVDKLCIDKIARTNKDKFIWYHRINSFPKRLTVPFLNTTLHTFTPHPTPTYVPRPIAHFTPDVPPLCSNTGPDIRIHTDTEKQRHIPTHPSHHFPSFRPTFRTSIRMHNRPCRPKNERRRQCHRQRSLSCATATTGGNLTPDCNQIVNLDSVKLQGVGGTYGCDETIDFVQN